MQPPPSYRQLFYQSDSQPVEILGEYELFCSSLENMERAESFATFEELVLEIRGRNQKYLVLTGSKTVKKLL